MPKFLEKILKAEAHRKGFTGKRADRYTFGMMNNEGLMRGNKETAKGARMDAKHARQERAGTAEDERPREGAAAHAARMRKLHG